MTFFDNILSTSFIVRAVIIALSGKLFGIKDKLIRYVCFSLALEVAQGCMMKSIGRRESLMNIKKAAEMFNLSVDTLRYYERVGVIPPVQRNASGYRDYTTNDLNWIYLAKNLRNAGLSVESLIEFAQLAQLRETQNVEEAQKQILFDQLRELDKKLTEMQEVRELLVYKIETYDDHIAKFKVGEMSPNKVEKLWERKK